MTEPDPLRAPTAELAVLGAALLSADALDDIDHLPSTDLADTRHRELLDRMRQMRAKGLPVDMATVGAALIEQPIRGLPPHDLERFTRSVPATVNAAWYAAAVGDAAARRRLVEAADRIRQMVIGCDAGPGETGELLARARGELEAATEGRATSDPQTVGDRIGTSLDDWEAPTSVTPTPWPDLNHVIHGWAPGRLYVIAARPGVGKSVMGVQAAAGVAKSGLASVVFSLEMTRGEVDARLISMTGRVDSRSIERRQLTDEDWTRIGRSLETLASLPLYVEDAVPLRVTDIRARVRAVARRRPVGLVVVDYLQLLAAPLRTSPGTARQEIVAGFARTLKELAKELGVAVLALSQLNRSSEQRANKQPGMADLRESGEIEQAADVIVLLHRDDEEADPTAVRVVVPKNRQGAQGAFPLQFEGAFSRMVSPVRHLGSVPRDWEAS